MFIFFVCRKDLCRIRRIIYVSMFIWKKVGKNDKI